MNLFKSTDLSGQFNYNAIYKELIDNLLGFMEMPAEFKPLLIPHLSMPMYYKEDTPILAVGEIAKTAYWPLVGYTRSYVKVQPDPDREHWIQKTVDISLPDQVTLATSSFMKQEPAAYYMEIARGSTMVSFGYDAFISMASSMPEVGLLALKIIAGAETDWLLKMDMCKVTCKQGYLNFLDHFDEKVEQHILLQHIASYLGMSREKLSRLRNS
jgi:hypothetical protein